MPSPVLGAIGVGEPGPGVRSPSCVLTGVGVLGSGVFVGTGVFVAVGGTGVFVGVGVGCWAHVVQGGSTVKSRLLRALQGVRENLQ